MLNRNVVVKKNGWRHSRTRHDKSRARKNVTIWCMHLFLRLLQCYTQTGDDIRKHRCTAVANTQLVTANDFRKKRILYSRLAIKAAAIWRHVIVTNLSDIKHVHSRNRASALTSITFVLVVHRSIMFCNVRHLIWLDKWNTHWLFCWYIVAPVLFHSYFALM